MGKLTSEAKIQLGIIHKMDVLKVLNQMELILDNIDNIDEFKDFSKKDFEELVRLTNKYHEILSLL
jgi:hypothetical protein